MNFLQHRRMFWLPSAHRGMAYFDFKGMVTDSGGCLHRPSWVRTYGLTSTQGKGVHAVIGGIDDLNGGILTQDIQTEIIQFSIPGDQHHEIFAVRVPPWSVSSFSQGGGFRHGTAKRCPSVPGNCRNLSGQWCEYTPSRMSYLTPGPYRRHLFRAFQAGQDLDLQIGKLPLSLPSDIRKQAAFEEEEVPIRTVVCPASLNPAGLSWHLWKAG